MKWSYQELAPPDFIEEATFDWSDGDASFQLHESIIRHGILSPLVVQAVDDQSFRLVDGFKRFHIFQQKQQETDLVFPCLVIPQDIPLPEVALWRMATWPLARKNTGMEVLKILTVFQKMGIDETIIVEQVLPTLGLKPSQKLLHDLRQLIELLKGIEQQSLATYTIEELLPLLKFSASETHAIVEEWKSLNKMGGNKWKSILQLLHEVRRFQNRSLTDILKSSEIQEILYNPELQAPVKFRLFKQQLEAWRYPELTASRRAFEHGLQQLQLPKRSQIQYDPFFEKDELLLTIKVASSKELQETLNDLQQNCQSTVWDDLFRIVHGA